MKSPANLCVNLGPYWNRRIYLHTCTGRNLGLFGFSDAERVPKIEQQIEDRSLTTTDIVSDGNRFMSPQCPTIV